MRLPCCLRDVKTMSPIFRDTPSMSGTCDATLRKRKRSYDAAPRKLRSLRIDLSPLSGATGSSHVQMGRTMVIAGIFGPAPLSTAGSAAMDSVDAMERARVVVDVQYAPGSVPLGDLAASEARVGALGEAKRVPNVGTRRKDKKSQILYLCVHSLV